MIETKWRDQCEAARGIRENFGIEKALGYLIGEKLTGFLWTSDRIPELRAELPAFVAEVKTIFEPWEIRDYLRGVRRVGPLGHVVGDETHEFLRDAGAIEEDVVSAAQDAILVERMKVLLLENQ